MNIQHATIDDIIKGRIPCPLDISLIPDTMGINLNSVDSITWTRQPDNQLVSVTIHFIPNANGNPFYGKMLAEEFDFTNRVLNALRGEGINTVGQLLNTPRSKLAKIPNLGKQSIQQIVDTIAGSGLSLKD